MRKRVAIIGCVLAHCAGLSGCAIHDPFRIWRFTADYNTEHQLSIQAEEFDSLPSKAVKTRLIKGAYNVGPSPEVRSTIVPPPGALAPSVPSVPGVSPQDGSDLLQQAAPPTFPNSGSPSESRGLPSGPTAGTATGTVGELISPTAYARPRTSAAGRPSSSRGSGSWLFSTPR